MLAFPLVVVALATPAATDTQTSREPATLILRAVDTDSGRPVPLAAAELYVDVWGGDDPIPLTPRGNEVRVPLGRYWLCAQVPVFCMEMYVAGRITIRARGYAALASDRFTWTGGADDVSN